MSPVSCIIGYDLCLFYASTCALSHHEPCHMHHWLFFYCLVTTLHTYEAYGYLFLVVWLPPSILMRLMVTFFGCLVTTLHTCEAYGYLFRLFGYHPQQTCSVRNSEDFS